MGKPKLHLLAVVWMRTCLGYMLGGYGGMDPVRSFMGLPGGYGGYQPSGGMGRALDEIDYNMRMFQLLKRIENGPLATMPPVVPWAAPVLAPSPQHMPMQYQPTSIGYNEAPIADPSESLEAPQHQPLNRQNHVTYRPVGTPMQLVGTVRAVPNNQPFRSFGRRTPPISAPSRQWQSGRPLVIHPPFLHSPSYDDLDRKQDELGKLKESAKEVQDSAVNMKESLHQDEQPSLRYNAPVPVQYPGGQSVPQLPFYQQPSMPQAFRPADQEFANMEVHDTNQHLASYSQSPNTYTPQQDVYSSPRDDELALKRAELERMKATVRDLQETAKKMKESMQNDPQPARPNVVPQPQALQLPPPQTPYSQPQYSWPQNYPTRGQALPVSANVASQPQILRSSPQQQQQAYPQQQYSWPQNYQPRGQPAPPAYVNPPIGRSYLQGNYPGRRPWYSRLPNKLLPRQYQQPRSYP